MTLGQARSTTKADGSRYVLNAKKEAKLRSAIAGVDVKSAHATAFLVWSASLSRIDESLGCPEH